MKTIHKNRLRKLIAFLRKLPPRQFDFATIREVDGCGAVGCAIGWTPEVFPRQIKLDDEGEPILREEFSTFGALTKFREIAIWLTGLDEEDAKSLFMPGEQIYADCRLSPLLGDATPNQVAAMLENFIQLQEAK